MINEGPAADVIAMDLPAARKRATSRRTSSRSVMILAISLSIADR